MYVRVENKERQFVNIYLNTFLPTEWRLTWELSLIRRDEHVYQTFLCIITKLFSLSYLSTLGGTP